jgi:hypothetical protein
MRAKNLTQPKKTKCECGSDLPNTSFAPPVKSRITSKEICADCKVREIIGEIYGI